jgi:hypothetical protein
MYSCRQFHTALLAFFFLCVLTPPACKKAEQTERPPVMVELYEPEATRTTMTVQGMTVEAVNCKVKYRFTQGKPADRTHYKLSVLTDCANDQDFKGSDLKPEGVMEATGRILRQMPDSVTIRLLDATYGGHMPFVSNDVTCPVR